MTKDDAFEAALAAGDTQVQEVEVSTTEETSQVAVEVENDENAEFRNALRNAPGELVCRSLLRWI